jgi:hypothetical protein
MSEELLSAIKDVAVLRKRSVNYIVCEELERAFIDEMSQPLLAPKLDAETSKQVLNLINAALAKLGAPPEPKAKPKAPK